MAEIQSTARRPIRRDQLDPSPLSKRAIDLVGKHFGKLTVLAYAGKTKDRHGTKPHWLCRCECGTERIISGGNLKSGRTITCGCAWSKYNRRYDGTTCKSSPIYRTWQGVVRRTSRDSVYIQRGMCEGFRDFAHFERIIGDRPEGFTLDRINNNLGYWCGCCEECIQLGRSKNVRWADAITQANNKSNNRKITYDGESLTIPQWAARLGIPRSTLQFRLRPSSGWSREAIFNQARRSNPNSSTFRAIHNSDELQEEAASLYRDGSSLNDIALRYRSDREYIRKLLISKGCKIRSRAEGVRATYDRRRVAKAKRQRLLF